MSRNNQDLAQGFARGVTSREGRVSRNSQGWEHGNDPLCVTSREGRVSRNRLPDKTSIFP